MEKKVKIRDVEHQRLLRDTTWPPFIEADGKHCICCDWVELEWSVSSTGPDIDTAYLCGERGVGMRDDHRVTHSQIGLCGNVQTTR